MGRATSSTSLRARPSLIAQAQKQSRGSKLSEKVKAAAAEHTRASRSSQAADRAPKQRIREAQRSVLASPPRASRAVVKVAKSSQGLKRAHQGTTSLRPKSANKEAVKEVRSRPKLTPKQAVEHPPSPRSPSASSRSSCSSEVQITNIVTPAKRPRTDMTENVMSPNSGFQAAVTEKLQALCGEHEDAKVLAEYIVVMAAGNKGREEMAGELQDFFPDKTQVKEFVKWVEECKWKFLTGGPSPQMAPSKAPQSGAGSLRNGSASSAASKPHDTQVRPGHVVTRRVSLQPHPSFAESSSPAPPPANNPPPPVRSAVASGAMLASPVASSPSKREKNELLESMTQQLQLILTKLSDRTLNDETREKYQALAQSIQTQMAKISRPKVTRAPPRRR